METKKLMAQIPKWLFLIWVLSSVPGCKDISPKRNTSDILPEMAKTECIERIFEKDSLLGEIRNHASEKISLSQSIQNYTKALESLDYTGCPEEFVSSFRKHIEAWKGVTKITDNYPHLHGELHDIFIELEKSKDSAEFKALVNRVWETWTEVKK
jgi:hypothetical protein